MKVAWKLYKQESGKYAYEGISEIPDSANLWDDNIIDIIAINQYSVGAKIITSRRFYLVVSLLENNRKQDSKFFEALFPAVLFPEYNNLYYPW